MAHNNNFNNNRNNQQRQQYKKSGASYTKIRAGGSEGFYHVSAWKSSKQGIITASCFPLSRKDEMPKVHKSERNDFITYVITIKQGINVSTYFSLMNLSTRKIFIKELGLIISPNGSGYTRSGKKVTGYFGIIKK